MTVRPEHRDLAGQEIRCGSHIVYAALWTRSAILKYGIVTRLKTRDPAMWSRSQLPEPMVGVITIDRDPVWDHSGPGQPRFIRHDWSLQAKGREMTLGFPDRMIVVPAESVPIDARRVLESAYDGWLEKNSGKE